MASKNMYYGDSNGTARQTKKLYYGDENGIAREVKKIFVGDENGAARLVYGGEKTTNIFVDGAFNASAMQTNFNFNSYKESGGIVNLSEFYLSEYVLISKQVSAEYFSISNNELRTLNTITIPYTSNYTFFPIKRINSPKKLLAKAKLYAALSTTESNVINIGGRYIDGNNAMIEGIHSFFQTYNNTQLNPIDIQVDLSDMPYIDYVYIHCLGSQPSYYDIKIVS